MAIVSVLTASSTQLLAAGVRNKVILTNEGANTVWCRFDAAGVLNEGFKLATTERIILDASKLELNNVLNAIAETADTNVSVYAF